MSVNVFFFLGVGAVYTFLTIFCTAGSRLKKNNNVKWFFYITEVKYTYYMKVNIDAYVYKILIIRKNRYFFLEIQVNYLYHIHIVNKEKHSHRIKWCQAIYIFLQHNNIALHISIYGLWNCRQEKHDTEDDKYIHTPCIVHNGYMFSIEIDVLN